MVGDLLHLSTGDEIPVDGILVKGCLYVNETGEQEIKNTYEESLMTGNSPVLISGTTVTRGSAWFIALIVGDDTCQNQTIIAIEQYH